MSSTNSAPRLPPVHARIRLRRAQIGLTGSELGERAGISTSYVSVIENGARVPEESVAAALARALGDDEALYRAWARAARLRVHDLELLNELDAIARTPALVSLVENGAPLPPAPLPAQPSGDGASGELAARLREVAFRLGPTPDVVAVPLLRPGEEPFPARPRSERLLLDARLFAGLDVSRPFAYEVDAGAAARLQGVAAEGDRVVFRHGGEPRPDRVSVVRTARGLTLARALVNERTVVLLPGPGEAGCATLKLAAGQARDEVVVGTQLLLIRR